MSGDYWGFAARNEGLHTTLHRISAGKEPSLSFNCTEQLPHNQHWFCFCLFCFERVYFILIEISKRNHIGILVNMVEKLHTKLELHLQF